MTASAAGGADSVARYVAVVGPGHGATERECQEAERVGGLLAAEGAILVCGGLGGVMEAASKGASERGGQAIGLLPGRDRSLGNRYLSAALVTGLGELRNGLIVAVSDAIIAVGGSWGTMSEIALAMRTNKPTVLLGGWEVSDPAQPETKILRRAATAEEAVSTALQMLKDYSSERT
jgi:uncharacterized protein (TIGR00725 family)